MWIVIRARLIAAAFRYGFRPLHHQRAAHLTELACGLRLYRVLAFRVVGTREKCAEAAAPLEHLSRSAKRTRDARLCLCFLRGVFLHEFAFRVIRTRDKCAEAALSKN